MSLKINRSSEKSPGVAPVVVVADRNWRYRILLFRLGSSEISELNESSYQLFCCLSVILLLRVEK